VVVRPHSVPRRPEDVPADDVEAEPQDHVETLGADRFDVGRLESMDEARAQRHDLDRRRVREEGPEIGPPERLAVRRPQPPVDRLVDQPQDDPQTPSTDR
jgi:hypothetical protein